MTIVFGISPKADIGKTPVLDKTIVKLERYPSIAKNSV